MTIVSRAKLGRSSNIFGVLIQIMFAFTAVPGCQKARQVSEINGANGANGASLSNGSRNDKWEKMTIDRIINGDVGIPCVLFFHLLQHY